VHLPVTTAVGACGKLAAVDEGSRRKLGDATRQRIADLAPGWNVSGQPSVEPETFSSAPRIRPAGSTPPAHSESGLSVGVTAEGTAETSLPDGRHLLDSDVLDSDVLDSDVLDSAVLDADGEPEGDAAAAAIAAATGSALDRALADIGNDSTVLARGSNLGRGTAPAAPAHPPRVDTAPAAPEPAASARDSAATVLVSEQTPPPPRPRVTASRSVASVRDVPTLPRRPGFVGDLRYVFTVAIGTARIRRELASLEPSINNERTRRGDALIELAAAAIGDDDVTHAGVVAARDDLSTIEERRALHAGATAAADEEIATARREHADDDRRRSTELAALDAELASTSERLAPLERELAAARRRAADLKTRLADLDTRIAATEIRAANRVGRPDAAAVAAELAALKSERVAAASAEPAIADELDNLTPRVAGLQATRADTEAAIARARAAQADAKRRIDEILAALLARKVVEDRAVADGESERRRALETLGEQLHADRPEELRFELAAIDERDLSLAQKQRRSMELRELLSSIDRAALGRGLFVTAVALISILAAVILAVVY
jgi:predicted  nucleic acid-binding Zn-ribbon protein